jgi:hypothetical protein
MGARGSRWTGAWWAATPAAAQQALDDLTEAEIDGRLRGVVRDLQARNWRAVNRLLAFRQQQLGGTTDAPTRFSRWSREGSHDLISPHG